MLKNYGYGGAYHDKNMAVSVLLENPLDYGVEAESLVFSVIIRGQNSRAAVPRLEDLTFYIMDEAHRLHKTRSIPYLKPDIEIREDDEPVRKPDGLIITDFNHKFLFQDLRIAFSYRPCGKIIVIELKH